MTESSEPGRASIAGFVADLKSESRVIGVLLMTVASLMTIHYVVMPPWFAERFPERVYALSGFTWWAMVQIVVWVAIPFALAHRWGLNPVDLGLSIRGLRGKLYLYGLLYAVSAVFIGIAAVQPAFLDTYPFLRADRVPVFSWRLLLSFWAIYSVQFFCVEFFFRGFMIFTLKPRLGTASIAFMVIPYTMIHFDKPMAEAIAAVFGGTVLGWLALRTNSIWGGVLLHVAIALSMDTLAMMRSGFPQVW